MHGQITNEQFGKNRVQYHDDFKNWWMYETDNFITYWYGKERNIAQAVIQTAEMDHNEILKILEHRINDKIEIIVYLDLTDLKQSNLGSEEAFTNKAGQTKIIDNKMFVYFNGDHRNLRRQIREGIASVYINAMLYGSNLQEIVQNAVLLDLPEWYKDGLISFIGSTWNPEVNQALRQILLDADQDDSFGDLARAAPKVVGHSMWHYIAQTYGRSTIANLLYLTRINHDLENGFLYVLGIDFETIENDWREYYNSSVSRLQGQNNSLSDKVKFDLKIKEGQVVSHLKTRPNHPEFIYVTNELGKYRLWKYNYQTEKKERLLRIGHCNAFQETDYNYPILSWTEKGNQLLIIYEKRDKIYLRILGNGNEVIEEHVFPERIHRIYDAEFYDYETILFTGSDNGYSDIFSYKIKTRQSEKLTDDFYDDLELCLLRKSKHKGFIFSSNRPNNVLIPRNYLDTVLPVAGLDLFFYELDSKAPVTRLTHSTINDEKGIVQMDSDNIMFLSDKTGVWNRRYINLSSILANEVSVDLTYEGSPISDFSDNIINHHMEVGGLDIIDVFNTHNRYSIYLSDAKIETTEDGFTGLVNRDRAKRTEVVDSAQLQYNLDYENFFVSEYGNPKVDTTIKPKNQSSFFNEEVPRYKYEKIKTGRIPKYIHSRAIAHRLRFKLDYFTTNLDNSLLFGGLDTYAGTKEGFENPPLGILLKGNIKDLFEDYVIEGGTRITTSFNGAEHFLALYDRKTRVDKTYALYRKSIKDLISDGQYTNYRFRNTVFIGMFEARYPFNIFMSLRASATFRNDKYRILSADRISLEAPTYDEQRLGMKVEFVYDNTLDVDLNIKNGTRYKVYTEFVKRLAIDLDPFLFETKNGFMAVVGADFRHYQRLLKHSVFALRLNGATSFGSEKIIHFIGGTNNWLFPSFNDDTPFPPGDEYAYQTIGTNLRGFDYNIRNGGTYFLANNEFRIPVMKYLTKRKIRFTLLRNLQLIGFFDIGMAWFGNNPFGRDNPINSVQLNNPAVNLDVLYFRDPLVYGYGFGARTTLFGYFLRFDWAWGVETRLTQPSKFYLSMGLDF